MHKKLKEKRSKNFEKQMKSLKKYLKESSVKAHYSDFASKKFF